MAFRNPLTSLPASGIVGLVQSNQIVAELLGKIITGALIRTATAGEHWELDSVPANELRGYTGLPQEIKPASIGVDATGSITMVSPDLGGPVGSQAQLSLATWITGAPPYNQASLIADEGFVGPLHWNTATQLMQSSFPLSAPNMPLYGETPFVFAAVAAVTNTINFPAGRFTLPPIFVGTVRTGVQRLVCTIAAAATVDSISVKVATADNTPISGTVFLNWSAGIPG